MLDIELCLALQAGEQGRLRLRRGLEQQDPRLPAAQLRATQRGASAPQGPHLHARSDLKSGENHTLADTKTQK